MQENDNDQLGTGNNTTLNIPSCQLILEEKQQLFLLEGYTAAHFLRKELRNAGDGITQVSFATNTETSYPA